MTKPTLTLRERVLLFVRETSPDKILREPFFDLLASIDKFCMLSLAKVMETKGIPEDERGPICRDAYKRMLGRDAVWVSNARSRFSSCAAFTISDDETKIVFRGTRRFPTHVDGEAVSVFADTTCVFSVDLIVRIFEEMDWGNINETPPRPESLPFPPPSSQYVPKEIAGSMWPVIGVDAIVDTLQNWIAEKRVSLVPRGDGSFLFQVEGVEEIVAEKKKAKGLRRKRREFAERFNVSESEVVKDWMNLKLSEAVANNILTAPKG